MLQGSTGRRALTALLLIAAALAMPTASALAQGWWPWSGPSAPERPRPLPPPSSIPSPIPGGPVGPGPGPAPGAWGPRGPSNICLQLERQLAQEANRGTTSKDALPKLEQDMRTAERAAQTANQQLERLDCFEYFLFSKTLRRTRQCTDLAGQAETAKRRIAELDSQRQQMMGSRGQSYQDEIIRELARNNCGAQYTNHPAAKGARSPWASIWQDGDPGDMRPSGPAGTLPFATYRTLCVRLCDGYYFPISFSTMQNHFQRDADACQQRCPAGSELYYHQNPGGAVEQMVSARSQQPYSTLKTAFRYRKEYVTNCTCRPEAGTAGAPGTPPAAPASERKAEAPAGAPPPIAVPFPRPSPR